MRERAARREAEQESAPPEPTGPIPIAELHERARVESRSAAPGLTAWLVAEGYAERTPAGLVATGRGLELGSGIA